MTAQTIGSDQVDPGTVVPESDPAIQASTPPNDPPDPSQDPANRDTKGRFNGVQPRIDELTRKRHEAEREAAYWRGIAEGRTPVQQQPTTPAVAPKPVKTDFQDYDLYVDALTDWKSAKVRDEVKREMAQESQSQRQTDTRRQTWETRAAEYATKTPDFFDVVNNSEVPISPAVGTELSESDQGPAIAYYLTKNPDVAEKLNKMTPRQVIREIARIEGIVSSSAPPPAPAPEPQANSGMPQPAVPRVSRAPAPLTQLKGGSALPVDLAKASMEDYIAARKKQGASWAR